MSDSTPGGEGRKEQHRPPTLHAKKELGLTEDVELDPDSQNSPLDPKLAHRRPPPPRLVSPGNRSIFVGTVAFRDGFRCGKTLFTALSRAKFPERVRIGVVDQVAKNDTRCVDAYCEMARQKWNTTNKEGCRYRSSIRIDERDAAESRGPIVARHYGQMLIQHNKDEFCMSIDSHSIFTNDWDVHVVEDWLDTDNEMGILTTYLHDIHNFVAPNGTNLAPPWLPHICGHFEGGYGLVRNHGSTLISDMVRPQMTSLLGAGFIFGKCHAERRVPIDGHTQWMFDGEEYMRAALLWTAGYDLYSPTGKGHVLYHNYSAVPAYYHSEAPGQSAQQREQKQKEEELASSRIKLLLGMEFQGMIDTRGLNLHSRPTPVRRLEQFLTFSGVVVPDNSTGEHPKSWKHNHTCYQLHWIPYENPQEIEALLPGWKSHAPNESATTSTNRNCSGLSSALLNNMVLSQVTLLPPTATRTRFVWVQFTALICLVVVIVSKNRRIKNPSSSM